MIGPIGYLVNGDYFCPDCLDPDPEEEYPIFRWSETDSFNHCASCEALIPEGLTNVGWDWLISVAEDHLRCRSGRVEIEREWCEHAAGWAQTEGDKTIMRLWGAAMAPANVDALQHNVSAQIKGRV